MDRLTPEQRHKNMSHIRNKDSKIEQALRKALWKKGYRYRKNYSELPGKPDIVLTKYRIAIFCDSEFFHGKDFEKLKKQLDKSDNRDFWIEKIKKNIERDQEINKTLRSMDWKVLRFWGKEILGDVDGCVRTIEEQIFDIMVESEEYEDV